MKTNRLTRQYWRWPLIGWASWTRTNFFCMVLLGLMLGANCAKAQTAQQINGVVNSSDGVLESVTVTNKQRGTSTQTDNRGRFSIAAINGDVLIFTSIGFVQQSYTVSGNQAINITLVAGQNDLGEVVVVAYGKQKKSNLTTAVTQITAQNIEKRPLRSLADGLIGQVAGLNIAAPSGAPEATLNLNIRGFTGFNRANSPLILVDGVERNINDINPTDVESVTVLKDAAATAIYGSRAPYGVLLITTKSGKKNQKTAVSYSTNVRYSTIPNQPEFANSWDFMEVSNNGYYNNDPSAGRNPFYSQITIDRARALGAGDYNNAVFNGLKPEEVRAGVYAVSPVLWAGHNEAFANTDWFDVALKKWTPSQQHDLNISGGTEKTNYYLGLGYNETNGIFKGVNDHKNRYSFLGKYNIDVTNWLSTNFSANYVRSDDLGPNYTGQGRNYNLFWNIIARSYPWYPQFNPNGSFYRFNGVANSLGGGGSEGTNTNDFTLRGEAVVKPLKGWEIRGSYVWRTTDRDYTLTTFPLYQILPNGTQVLNQRSAAQSSLARTKSNNNYYTANLISSYERDFEGGHNFSALVGYQAENSRFSQIGASGNNLISQSITTLGNTLVSVPATEILYDWGTVGVFGRIDYNYKERYFIELNGRYDGNSSFNSTNPKDKYGFFPSVSAAWNAANEKFFPLKDHISVFKLRGSYANSGNGYIDLNSNGQIDKSEYYLFSPSLGISTSRNLALDGSPISAVTPPASLIPSSLTWEKPRTIGFGVDIQALKNRLDVSYDWYQRTTKDQAGRSTPLPEVLGIAEPFSNNTVSETRGWEFTANWRDKAFMLAGAPVNYQAGFRISDYMGYVVSYKADGTGQIGAAGQWIPGQRFGQNRFVTSNGIIQDEQQLNSVVPYTTLQIYPGDLSYQDLNGDGMISIGDRWYNQGDAPYADSYSYPRYTYGLTLGLDWKGINVLVNMDGVGKRTVYSTNQYVFGNNGNTFFAPYFKEQLALGYWASDNTSAFFPRNELNTKNLGFANQQYALNLANLRLRNIRVGYDLPSSLLQKIKVRNLGLYFSGENLGFIYQKSFIKMDPEVLAAAGGEGYPPSRIYSFGLTLGL